MKGIRRCWEWIRWRGAQAWVLLRVSDPVLLRRRMISEEWRWRKRASPDLRKEVASFAVRIWTQDEAPVRYRDLSTLSPSQMIAQVDRWIAQVWKL